MLLELTDRNSGQHFLVDTKADVSIVLVSPSLHPSVTTPAPVLHAANVMTIKCFRHLCQLLQFGCHSFTAHLLVANVARPTAWSGLSAYPQTSR